MTTVSKATIQTTTTHLVEAYSLCPRKAWLLLTGEDNPGPNEYARMIEEQRVANRETLSANLTEGGKPMPPGSVTDLRNGPQLVVDAELEIDGCLARCDFLKKVNEPSRLGSFSYEPMKVIGTQRASRSDALGLAYQGLVLGDVQGKYPASATLVLFGNRRLNVRLAAKYKQVRRIVEALRVFEKAPVEKMPPIVLNKHCPMCPFQGACLQQAEKEDNLSLLDRMTPKAMRKYHDKGIFTVKQLSYIYKPRRSRKKARRPARHSLELQALAIRTKQIQVEQLPELSRQPVELFLDLEGIPDRDFYYLAGLLIRGGEGIAYESFWADDTVGEAAMWSALVDRLDALPDAPVYHYGSYEKKAFAALAKRHGKGCGLENRLVNVASFVFGRVYFPVRSNGLKALGRFIGAAWSDPLASGLQSLVWRYRWEATHDENHRESLLRYNHEDCNALCLLVDRLDRIGRNAATDPEVEFARRPKQIATETGKAVHDRFERILQDAQEDGQRRSVRPRVADTNAENVSRKKGAPKGHQAFRRVAPAKVGKIIRVAPKRKCPRGHGDLVLDGQSQAERTVTDLVFTRNGCRKVVTRYTGTRALCPKCKRDYPPPSLKRLCRHEFGHGFQAWTIYQRIVLRLPYRIITQVTEHLFGVGFSIGTIVSFLQYQAHYYAVTEAAMLDAIRKGPFVHVDETRINIQGMDHYVWVFTDGQHVLFRMTETREADVVREVLDGFTGVLVSDFYPGYDSIPCRQQKCLVHLIRDINDDLWTAPFDRELEVFAVEFQCLLTPMLETIHRYGLKAFHLRKFLKDVDQFYEKCIIGREYASESVRTYQKRFDRYRDSLFVFLTEDGIPWENNMAERAIRQLAVQRKISGTFFKRVAPQYLLLLAISQTCRFQGKSFLKFLLSKQTVVDSFRQTRPIQYSAAVAKREDQLASNDLDNSPSVKIDNDENVARPQ